MGNFEKKNYEHVSNSEQLPSQNMFESPDLTFLDFCLWVWMNSKVYKRKVDTPDELLARILYAAACIKEHEDKLRRKTSDLRTRVAKCTEVDSGDLRTFLCSVTRF